MDHDHLAVCSFFLAARATLAMIPSQESEQNRRKNKSGDYEVSPQDLQNFSLVAQWCRMLHDVSYCSYLPPFSSFSMVDNNHFVWSLVFFCGSLLFCSCRCVSQGRGDEFVVCDLSYRKTQSPEIVEMRFVQKQRSALLKE